MRLTEKQKQAIKEEYNSFKEAQYAGKTKEERQKLGQYFTPAEISIKMIEQYSGFKENETILDPAMGAGGLLAAVIVAGLVKPENCYGIEIDPVIFEVAKKRLNGLGVDTKYFTDTTKFSEPCKEVNCLYENHFYLGDALQDVSYDFPYHRKLYVVSDSNVVSFRL